MTSIGYLNDTIHMNQTVQTESHIGLASLKDAMKACLIKYDINVFFGKLPTTTVTAVTTINRLVASILWVLF